MPKTVARRRLMADAMPIEQGPLHFDLVAAVERDRPDRRFLGAELARLADAVTAVGDGQNDALVRADMAEHVDDGLFVGRGGRERIAIAERRTDERGERNDDVGILQQRAHRIHRPHVAAHEGEVRVIADGRARLSCAVHEVVDDGDREAALEQRRDENRAEISRAAGHENLRHRDVRPPVSADEDRSSSAREIARVIADEEAALVRGLALSMPPTMS